ncbi:hypothetical protein [Fangia hongkongensis]|uniref:hypothetical protein n=1 Tax=Fangia hongkongensis TaxID=270495 RepID=UPI00037BF16D|nr:hypothetical protein [Fangia hongkongensis]MBK2125425.1 hypothetical protein [Fangia hongkongensis]
MKKTYTAITLLVAALSLSACASGVSSAFSPDKKMGDVSLSQQASGLSQQENSSYDTGGK